MHYTADLRCKEIPDRKRARRLPFWRIKMQHWWRIPITLGYLLAIGLRIVLLCHDDIRGVIEARVEVSTPVTSFKRMKEGAFLWDNGASPYSGDALHQPPILLLLSKYLRNVYACMSLIIIVVVVVIIIIIKRYHHHHYHHAISHSPLT